MSDNIEDYGIFGTAEYDNPKNPVEKPDRKYTNQRTLVVMNTYIPNNIVVEYNTRNFDDHSYTRYSVNRLETLKFTLACYDHYKAGADYDLVIVDNSSPSEVVKKFLSECGHRVLFRENTYYSFGAYKHAFEELGKDYDYFVFHEFDWVPCKNNWLRDLINYWNSDNKIGMIGNLIEDHSPDNSDMIARLMKKINKDRDYQYNLDSEYLFTDKIVLENMIKTWGGWNIFPCSPSVDETPVINELGLQQPILEMGYKLACFNDGKHTMFYSLYNCGFPKSGKWWHGFKNLAPYIPEQTRFFIQNIKKYFWWHNHEANNSFVSWI